MNVVVRAGFRSLSALSPALAARAAGRLWFRIPKSRAGDTAKAFLDTGERFTVAVNGRSVAAWRWGTGPTVILLHGWGGHAGQFQSLVQGFSAAGVASVVFDAPSHGESEPGALGARYSTLFEFADALRSVASRTREPIGVIAHSGGCAAVAWAMANEPKLAVKRASGAAMRDPTRRAATANVRRMVPPVSNSKGWTADLAMDKYEGKWQHGVIAIMFLLQ